jgi:hypothetical protein
VIVPVDFCEKQYVKCNLIKVIKEALELCEVAADARCAKLEVRPDKLSLTAAGTWLGWGTRSRRSAPPGDERLEHSQCIKTKLI